MIHYNIWFSFRAEVEESMGLRLAEEFLGEMEQAGGIAGFRLLRNCGSGPKTERLPFQALIEFRDDAQFSLAFSAQAARGIHTGLHGRMMALVERFQVEVFREIERSAVASDVARFGEMACEI